MADSKKKGFIAEFREFATRGNVIDMAVGVIIATAFGKITSSLVNDVFMPAFGYLFGGMDFSQLNIVLREATKVNGVDIPAIVIGIGTLIATVVDFLLIALCIFVFVKLINTAKERAEARRKQEEAVQAEADPPAPTKEELLLTEIRDLLKDRA